MKIDLEKYKKFINDEVQYSIDCGERPMEDFIVSNNEIDAGYENIMTKDYQINKCDLQMNFVIQWSIQDIGFGEFYFHTDIDGTTHCDNEMMDKKFIKAVLIKMVDDCVLDDD